MENHLPVESILRTSEQQAVDYKQFRGKCREKVNDLITANPSLVAVRGHYYDFQWGEQPHWWAVDLSGKIIDPTAAQFPSNGMGVYTPFDGWVNCAECDIRLREQEASFESNYAFCSTKCHMKFVGL